MSPWTLGESAGQTPREVVERAQALPWQEAFEALERHGHAVLGTLLDPAQASTIAGQYDEAEGFRRRVVMARHGYGSGEYRYFNYPLPPLVAAWRHALYRHLVPLADGWRARLGGTEPFPPTLAAYLRRCHAAGQSLPTPLVLRYRSGDHNCLHQDLYGALRFPLQVVVLLSRPGEDFEGGELVLTEQRPRMQARAEVVHLRQGEAVVFASADRPMAGPRGWHRARMRHGVSRVRSGERHALGIIFHDASG